MSLPSFTPKSPFLLAGLIAAVILFLCSLQYAGFRSDFAVVNFFFLFLSFYPALCFHSFYIHPSPKHAFLSELPFSQLLISIESYYFNGIILWGLTVVVLLKTTAFFHPVSLFELMTSPAVLALSASVYLIIIYLIDNTFSKTAARIHN